MPALPVASRRQRPRLTGLLRTGAVLALLFAVIGGLATAAAYRRYSRMVDRRITHSPLFFSQARLQPAARPIRHGHPATMLRIGSQSGHRRVPAYDALPPDLVRSVVAIEDRRFFEHSGVNYVRTAECAVQDAISLRMACGGSTLTQQLARNSFLSARKTLHRKLAEILIAHRLEKRFNKQQIFAMYAAEVNLGQDGPTPIRGFRRAAQVYFGRPLSELDLAQCALLAGMVQRPNFYNPYRHPERALARRNLVLDVMVHTGALTPAQADEAKAEPLDLAALQPQEPAAGAELVTLAW